MLSKLSTLQDVHDLYQWFQQMRETQPVWFDENSGCWHVFRFTDVNTVITEHQLFRQGGFVRSYSKTPSIISKASNGRRRGSGPTILTMNPPRHREYRSYIAPLFTPSALSAQTDRIKAIAQELLDQVRMAGYMDFIADFAYPLPAFVIAEMLGVPVSDRSLCRQWADRLLSSEMSDAEAFQPSEQVRDHPQVQDRRHLFEEMSDYFEEMLEDRRLHPRNDMMSKLLEVEISDGQMSREDVISHCILLFLSGHVTTTNLLCHAMRCLNDHPDALAQLRKDPTLVSGAIEETLRYAAPDFRLLRWTNTDVSIEGVQIPKDSPVFGWLASANRDERQFPDPERFDITRTPNRHLAFGHGIHFCVGAPLSRLEASIVLPMLIEELPDFQIVSDSSSELRIGFGLFGFKQLPMTFNVSTSTRR